MAGCVVKRGRFRIYRLFIGNMAIIRLTEGDLRRAIRNVLSESSLLTEGYSGKYFDSQIRDIVSDFMMVMYRYHFDGSSNGETSKYYNISISLKPFFKEGDNIDPEFLVEKDYRIKLIYLPFDDSSEPRGEHTPRSRTRIMLFIPHLANENAIYSVLLHEVTHLVDDLIKTAKGHNSHKYPVGLMSREQLPQCIMRLLYHLWGSSEFNAWQASYATDERMKNLDEQLMSYLKEAYNLNDEDIWRKIQSFVVGRAPNLLRLENKSPMAFKDYFIKTSFKLIKRMVRKYK